MSVRIATGGAAEEVVGRVLPRLVDERIASGITAQDPELWGASAEADAAGRLGWTESVSAARPLAARIAGLAEELRADGVEAIVLCAGAETALGADVIARTQGVPLTVLDGTDPDRLAAATESDLAATAVVLSSPTGEDPETDVLHRAFERAFREAGLDPARRFVVVTEPGSPLEALAGGAGYRLVTADPGARGAFSVLAAPALVPAGLAGADLGELIDEAESELLDLAIDAPANNGLVLGAALAGGMPGRRVLALVEDGTHLVGFGRWAEQLVAGATGKLGTGLLPVVLDPDAPELEAGLADVQVVRFVDDAHDGRHRARLAAGEILVSGSLGELLLVWEYAAAVAGRLLGVDPFDAPDLGPVRTATRALLDAPAPDVPPVHAERDVRMRASDGLAIGTRLRWALDALLAAVPADGYLALDVWGSVPPEVPALRRALAARLGRPVPLTAGAGPGPAQYHLGGPATGAFLELTTEPTAVPGRPSDHTALLAARARATAEALTRRGRPVLRIHLPDPGAAAALLDAASEAAR